MNLNKILTETISKTAVRTTRKPVANLRRDVAALKREVADLKRQLKFLIKQAQPAGDVDRKEATKLRPTSHTVIKLRKKLGLTRVQLAKLIGVSTLTVSKWETSGGSVRMRGKAMAGFARVRGIGKREALKALEAAFSGK